MLTGLPPFYSKDTNKMYEAILNHELSFPDYLSTPVVNLITNLMHKDPNKRFASISDVRKHAWFSTVNWN